MIPVPAGGRAGETADAGAGVAGIATGAVGAADAAAVPSPGPLPVIAVCVAGSIFTSACGLGDPADIVNSNSQVVHDAMRVPYDQERDAQQQADQHVSPERFKPQPQPVQDH